MVVFVFFGGGDFFKGFSGDIIIVGGVENIFGGE